MKKFILVLPCFFLFLAFPTLAFSQTEVAVPGANGATVFTFQMNTPDPDMRKVPNTILSQRQKDTAEFVRLLAEYITEKSSSDYDKVKKVHDWIALNIKYDTQSFFSGRHSPQNMDAVIRRGSAVCAGYAYVFKTICDELKIDCKIVAGYARGYNSGLFRDENVTGSNHDWNIVTIGGKKFLIDCTWNAGYVNSTKFVAKYQTDYLFADPSIFIYEHFPLDPPDQLLDQPISAEVFNNLPFLRPRFFQTMETWPKLAKITEVNAEEELVLEFSLKSKCSLEYAWLAGTGSGTTIIHNPYPSKKNGMYQISFPEVKPGNYILQLFTRIPGDDKWQDCGEFGFVVR